MGNLKAFLLLCTVAVLSFTACNKDTALPIFDEFKVDGAATTAQAGNHDLGTTVSFEITASDDSSLGFYEISEQNGTLLTEGILDGNTDTFTFDFSINPADYSVGENITLVFLIQDGRGSSNERNYTISVN